MSDTEFIYLAEERLAGDDGQFVNGAADRAKEILADEHVRSVYVLPLNG